MSAPRSGGQPGRTAPPLHVIELRQYTLKPGGGDVLLDLFERELIEPQEEVGLHVLGQFRDLADPDRFVWLRGFTDMEARREGLKAFYGGPVWKRHSDAANATMIDSDDVLLLRPVAGGAVRVPSVPRPSVGAQPTSLVTATVYSFSAPPAPQAVLRVGAPSRSLQVVQDALGAAVFETEPAINTFPGLPVREGEHVLVRLDAFSDDASAAPDPAPGETALAEIGAPLLSAPLRLRLRPGRRSMLR